MKSKVYLETYKFDKEGKEIGEKGGREKITDQAFIPNSTLIKQMIAAGEKLDNVRRGNYDYEMDIDLDDELEDISRKRNVDISEVVKVRDEVIKRLAEQRKKMIEDREKQLDDKKKEDLRKEIMKEFERKGSPPNDIVPPDTTGGSVGGVEPPQA